MAVKSYGFAVGSLRSKENNLLSSNDYSILASAKNINSLLDLLKAKGIGEQTTDNCLLLIRDYNAQLWNYIEEIIPDRSTLEPIIWENDFHNLKAVMKCVLKGIDYDGYIIHPLTVEPVIIEKAVSDRNFGILPLFLKKAAEEGLSALNQTLDAQLSDGIIDSFLLTERLKRAKELKLPFIIEVLEISVFYSNIKAALRIAKSQKSGEFADTVLIDTDFISKKDLKNAVLSGEEKVLELLSKVDKMQGKKACELYVLQPWKMESFADRLILQTAEKFKAVNFGAEPILSYLIKRIYEEKNLRIIYSGVKSGLSAEAITERLRDING